MNLLPALLNRRLCKLGAALLLAAGMLHAAPSHADAIDTIAKSGKVRIGVFMDYPPFGSIGPDMQPLGYDIDMAELIGKALKTKVELVQVTGDNRMAYLAGGKVDLLLSVGQTPERAKVIDFSDAYAPYYLAVFGGPKLAIKNSADLAGKTIAVARGTLEDLSISKTAPAGATIKRFDDANGAISAFMSGQTQLMVVGNDVGATIMAKNPAAGIQQKFQLFSSPDHVGFNKNEARLTQQINQAIVQAKKDGSLNKISQEMAAAAIARRFITVTLRHRLKK